MMISEKTITTWIEEFIKVGQKDPSGVKALEWKTNMQASVIGDEPKFVSLIITLMDNMKFENSVSAAIYALAAYYECNRRQNEADKLSKDIG